MGLTVATTVGVADALGDVGTLFDNAVTIITGNPFALVFIGISLAGAGIGLFRRVIRR